MDCLFIHLDVLIVFIFICCWFCCKLGSLSTSRVWASEMHEVDIWTINIHVPWCIYCLIRGLSLPDKYKKHLDQLDLAGVIMSSYIEHHQTRLFEWVGLYSGWLRYSSRRVRYLPERVLFQFGYVQTIPRHSCENASPRTILTEIIFRYAHHVDHMLTP